LAIIPKALHELINTAFPANVCLVATVVLPDGFAQVSPRGSTMVYDDQPSGPVGGGNRTILMTDSQLFFVIPPQIKLAELRFG